MSRGPPLGTLAWTSSRPEHSCRLPTPGRPSYFRNRPRQIQQGLPRGHRPPAWQRHGRFLPKKKQGRVFLWGFLTSPSGIPPLPCDATLPRELLWYSRDLERWQVPLSPTLGSKQCSVSILCLRTMTLGLRSLLSGYQCELAHPGLKGAPLFKRGIYIPVPATGRSKHMMYK